jgi:glycosyltransferase involved in cell wall biosynthesis
MSPTRKLTPLLAADMDLDAYSAAYDQGLAPDRYPYGMETLPEGWTLRPLPPRRFGRVTGFLRRAVRRLLVADVVGAWRRRDGIVTADVLYAHSEADYLGAAVVLRLCRARRPLLVGQTIWLAADWPQLSWWQRRFLRWAMARVDLFVYNAKPNKALGEQIHPRGRHLYVPFGISRSFLADESAVERRRGGPILSVGNDRSRDWPVLAEALKTVPADVPVRLATHKAPPGFERAVVRPTSTLAEICGLYAGASCLVVALGENAHAGGITTILEGAAAGVPVIATEVGGVEAYFGDSEVAYVPVGDADALSSRIRQVLDDPRAAAEMARRAHDRLLAAGYTNDVYWRRVLGAAATVREPIPFPTGRVKRTVGAQELAR